MKALVSIILVFGIIENICAQDPQFSQFYAAPLYLGPSMAGAAGAGRVCLNFRDQWPKLSGKYITYALSYDTYLYKYNSGAGLFFMRDDAGNGKITTVQVGLNYSYRIKLTKDFFVQPGLQVQYYERKINFSKLIFSDQFYEDQVLPATVEIPPDEQKGHMDFSTSVLAFTKKMWLGATLDHIMKTNQTLEKNVTYVPVKFSAFGGIRLVLNPSLFMRDEQSFLIAFNYRSQATMQQLDIGTYYHRAPFMVGLWYRGIPVIKNTRSKDAITISAGVVVKQLSFTYSYDLTVSTLITSTGGAHEIALVYLFDPPQGKRIKRKIMGAVPCPKF